MDANAFGDLDFFGNKSADPGALQREEYGLRMQVGG